ncbi:MAG: tetratricopeptide repeat protein [Bdellovibrionota bacterium]
MKQNPFSIFHFLLATVALVGCATGGGSNGPVKVKEDKAAIERSKGYFDGVDYGPARQVGTICAVPAGSERMLSVTNGASKEWKEWTGRANACADKKDWRTLEQLGQVMARVDLNSPWGAYYLSVAAEGRGDWARAMWMVDLAQKKAGGVNALFAYQKGRILLNAKETTKAMAEFERATSLSPAFGQAHLYLAQIYHRDMEWSPAAKHYEAALGIESGNVDAMVGLAEAKLQKGDAAGAAELYSKAVGAQPSRGEAWIRLGFIYETLLKDNQQALNTYRGLKSSLEKSLVRERPSFDLNQKIKALEETVKPSGRAQASVEKTEKD